MANILHVCSSGRYKKDERKTRVRDVVGKKQEKCLDLEAFFFLSWPILAAPVMTTPCVLCNDCVN